MVEASAFLKDHPLPVIMNFRVTGFRQVDTPDELRRWEATVRDQVGLPVAVGSSSGSDSRTPSDTISAMSEGAVVDDCDYD